MAKLTDDIKQFIVEHLACYDTPSQVAAAVKDEFGITVDRRHIEEYDPAKRRPAKKWCEMHAAIRKAFLDGVSDEPAAQKAYRVRRLAKMARNAESRKNFPEARALYRQIAEEMGGMLTNRREITGKDGGPIATRSASLENMTAAELAALATQLAEGGTEGVVG